MRPNHWTIRAISREHPHLGFSESVARDTEEDGYHVECQRYALREGSCIGLSLLAVSCNRAGFLTFLLKASVVHGEYDYR